MNDTLFIREYEQLQWAFSRFNEELFDGQLSGVFLTFCHKAGATLGFYSPERFMSRNTEDSFYVSELALVPERFPGRTDKDILSTLAHEMCHHHQALYGSPSRNGYHNREWADLMESIGLVPSDTGEEGGKQTGQKMTHYIEEDGLFDQVCDQLVSEGFYLGMESVPNVPGKKRKDKVKYTCSACGANVWGKPGLQVMCSACENSFEEAEEADAPA